VAPPRFAAAPRAAGGLSSGHVPSWGQVIFARRATLGSTRLGKRIREGRRRLGLGRFSGEMGPPRGEEQPRQEEEEVKSANAPPRPRPLQFRRRSLRLWRQVGRRGRREPRRRRFMAVRLDRGRPGLDGHGAGRGPAAPGRQRHRGRRRRDFYERSDEGLHADGGAGASRKLGRHLLVRRFKSDALLLRELKGRRSAALPCPFLRRRQRRQVGDAARGPFPAPLLPRARELRARRRHLRLWGVLGRVDATRLRCR